MPRPLPHRPFRLFPEITRARNATRALLLAIVVLPAVAGGLSGVAHATGAPPTIDILDPQPGAGTICSPTVHVHVTDDVNVRDLLLFENGVYNQVTYGENFGRDAQVPMGTVGYAPGARDLRVVARDDDGNETSATLTVDACVDKDIVNPSIGVAFPGQDAAVTSPVTLALRSPQDVVRWYATLHHLASGRITRRWGDGVPPADQSLDLESGRWQIVLQVYDAQGRHAYKAVDFDVAGPSAAPATANPTARITSPVTGSTAGRDVDVTAEAADGVASLSLYANGRFYANDADSKAPWTIPYRGGDATQLVVEARDAAGHATTSETVDISQPPDNTGPQITYVSPPDGSRTNGGVTITARGIDEGRDTRVVLEVDGNPFADTSGAPNYWAGWSGEQRTQTHALTITAIDDFGNRTVQTTHFTVDVDNPPSDNPGPGHPDPPREFCPGTAFPVRINTPVVNATGAASVTVTGAMPYERIELQGYSQNHYGTASFDNDPTRVDRSGYADAEGTVTFSDLRPPSNTRLRAQPLNCVYPVNAASSVISVRTQLTLALARTGLRRYAVSGQSIPARPGGLIVSVYRVTGTGEVLIGQARADATTGKYHLTVTFPARDAGAGAALVVKTGQDAQNLPGRSNTRRFTIG